MYAFVREFAVAAEVVEVLVGAVDTAKSTSGVEPPPPPQLPAAVPLM